MMPGIVGVNIGRMLENHVSPHHMFLGGIMCIYMFLSLGSFSQCTVCNKVDTSNFGQAPSKRTTGICIPNDFIFGVFKSFGVAGKGASARDIEILPDTAVRAASYLT